MPEHTIRDAAKVAAISEIESDELGDSNPGKFVQLLLDKSTAQLQQRVAELEVAPRVERCCECNGLVSDWVEADHRDGRICRPCETVIALRVDRDALKAQLDEAQEDLSQTRDAHQSLRIAFDLERARAETAERERDEYKAQFERRGKLIEKAADERQSMDEEYLRSMAELRKERDEARAACLVKDEALRAIRDNADRSSEGGDWAHCIAFDALALTNPGAPLMQELAALREERAKASLVSHEFVQAMHAELLANAHKGDWSAWNPRPDQAMSEFDHHDSKLRRAVDDKDAAKTREYAADIANICMKIWEGAKLPAAPGDAV